MPAISDVVLDIDLNTDNVEARAQQLQQILSNMMKSVDGKTVRIELKQVVNAMREVMQASSRVTDQMKALQDSQELFQSYSGDIQYYYSLLQDIAKAQEVVNQKTERGAELQNAYAEAVKRGATEAEKKSLLGEMAKNTQELKDAQQKLVDLQDRAKNVKEYLDNLFSGLKDAGFDWEEVQGNIDEFLANLTQTADRLNDKMGILGQRFRELSQQDADNVYLQVTFKVVERLTAALQQLKKLADELNRKFLNWVSNIMKFAGGLLSASKNAKKLNNSLDSSAVSMKKLGGLITRYVFGVRSVYFLIRKIRAFAKSGFENILSFLDESGAKGAQKEFQDFYNAIEQVRTALENLRYSLVAAFMPLVTVVAPIVAKLLNWISKLLGYVAQLIAYLTGSNTYLAVNAKAIKKITEETKKKNKADNKQLSSLDKLNNMTTKKDTKDDTSKYDPSKLFTKKPIDSWVKNLGDKLKALWAKIMGWLKRIWAPIKKAWDEVKDYVIGSFKRMVKAIGKFLKGMIEGFVKAWEVHGYEISKALLNTIGNVFNIIAVIFKKLDEAFLHNNNYFRFWDAILTCVEIIAKGLDDITLQMLDWLKTSIRLEAVVDSLVEFLYSMAEPVQFMVDLFKLLITKVFEPLVVYLVKADGFFDRLFQRLTEFNNNMNWDNILEKVEPVLQDIEKILENIGDAIFIIVDNTASFIEKLSEGEIDNGFLSIAFDLIKQVWDYIKSLSPEEIANIAESLAGIPAALAGFSIAATIVPGLLNFGKSLYTLGNTLKFMLPIIQAMGPAAPAILAVAAALAVLVAAVGIGIGGEVAGDAFLEGLPEQLNKIVQTVEDFIDNMDFDELGVRLANNFDKFMSNINFGNIAETISKGLAGIIDTLASMLGAIDWDKLVVQIVDFIVSIDWGSLAESLAHLFLNLIIAGFKLVAGLIEASPESILGMIKAVGEVLIGALEALVQFTADIFRELGLDTIAGFIEGIADKVGEAEQKFSDFITGIIDKVKEWLGIHSPSTVFADIGNNIIQGLIDGIQALWENLSSAVENIINGLIEAFTTAKDTLIEIFNGIWTGIKSVINSIIGGVEKMANSIVKAVNTMIGALNGLKFDIPNWIPDFGGKKFGLNIPKVPEVKLPRLAQGTVVPPSASEFAAILGDNNRETEVVSPLSTMTQAFKDALSSMNFGAGSLTATAQVSGRDLLEILVEENTKYKRQYGSSAF